jgi:hypothetical protein
MDGSCAPGRNPVMGENTVPDGLFTLIWLVFSKGRVVDTFGSKGGASLDSDPVTEGGKSPVGD